MKRSISLLTLLLLFLFTFTGLQTASASFSPTSGKTYVLKHVNSDYYLSLNTGSYTETNAVNATTLAASGTAFTITQTTNGYTFAYDSHYLGQSTSYKWNTSNSVATEWTIEDASTSGQYYIKGANGYLGTDASTAGSYIYTNKSSADAWEFIDASTLTTCTVTYTYTYNGTTVGTETLVGSQGEAYPDPTTLPYGVTVTKLSGNLPSASIASATLACTYDNSIQFSTAFSSAQWYRLTMRSGTLHYVSSSSIPETSAAMTGDYYFAFIGTPFSFNIVNYAAGEGNYVVGAGTSTTATDFVAYPTTNSSHTYGNFYIKVKGTTNKCLNDVNNALGFWNNTNAPGDVGSQIGIEAVSLDDMQTIVTYSVSVSGSTTGGLTYNGTTYTNGGSFSADAGLTASAFEALSVDDKWATISVSGTTITVTYKDILFDSTKTYTLRSASNTYLNLGTSDDNGNSSNAATSVFYSETPSYFTITQQGSGYVFKDENNHYIGVASWYYWNVNNTSAEEWTVEAVSGEDDAYTLKCSRGYLGNTSGTTTGTGVYTNQGSAITWYIEEYVQDPYSVSITTPTGYTGTATLTYDGETYTNGQQISASHAIKEADLTATRITGYSAVIAIEGTAITLTYTAAVTEDNPQCIKDFLDRIGGTSTSSRIETLKDEGLLTNGLDAFVITAKDGKPQIQGSSYSAITAGIGWYLNHQAKVNLAWNNGVRADLSAKTLPVPSSEETHTCDADYRYYLNYCTYGYSMTTWTWDRWEKEIDWMALHGINMPLQIIGLEQVWKSFLTEDCGYSEANAEAFVPGPAYIGWWGMNNLYGVGGDGSDQMAGVTDDAWYARQVELGQKILARERSLGMDPVLPGFSGMVPNGFTNSESQGSWNSLTRPYILDPTDDSFATRAAQYYAQLAKVMGTSKYYSMDPFHEGGTISSGNYSAGYTAVYDAMNTNCGDTTKWVIQQWQWASYQRNCLTAVPSGRLIVLDLFSDGNPAFDSYSGYSPQEAVYCAIPNFGGRTGFFGRIPKMADNYFSYKAKYSTIKGIGAAPEAIEQTPVVYDLLFELPWMGSQPNTVEWMQNYVSARYGTTNANATTAWETLRSTALNNTTTLQGPHEAVICGRPSLSMSKVSYWGGTSIFYDQDEMVDAAFKLLAAGQPTDALGAENYSYDLCDITRQALTDYAKTLLESLNSYSGDTSSSDFTSRRDAFLGLILDIDSLLGSNRMFRLGNWTETARNAANEVTGATTATADWYELYNARQLITTWADYATSENSHLRDYSYREWQGMLKDFYYPRWKYWFDNGMSAPSNGWFYTEWNWAHETGSAVGASAKGTTGAAATRTYYSATPEGSTYDIANYLLHKYFTQKTKSDGTTYYDYYLIDSSMDDLWTKPTQNLADLSTIQSYSQYVSSLSASVNSGTATTIYTATTCPTTLYNHTDTLSVAAGDAVSLTWPGNSGLQYCYMSAYLDSDGDGVFDETPFATLGTSGATNSAVASGTISFTVPTDLTKPVTHVRLRFDSAWNIGSTADASTNRMVYEIPLYLPANVVRGDVNLDGMCSLSDLAYLIAILNGTKVATLGADVNQSNSITLEDAAELLNILLKK